MAKIEKASEDVVELFDSVLDNTTINSWVKFEVLSCNKQKSLYRIVKSNDITEILSEGVNFAVIINENVFDQLTDDQKKMAIDECLAGVCISDNDALSLKKPNFCTHKTMLQKYGHEPMITLGESIESIYDAIKQKEAEEKASKKGKRGRIRKAF